MWGWGVSVYNRLVKSRNASKEALYGIDVALETRFDQIKAQADAVSGIKKEVDVILGATALRKGRTIEQLDMQEKTELNSAMGDAEQQILAKVSSAGPGALVSREDYPTMRGHDNVEIMQRTINEVEERLQAARRVYNRAATKYNTSRETFPAVLIARPLGFSHHELFELTDKRKETTYDLKRYQD